MIMQASAMTYSKAPASRANLYFASLKRLALLGTLALLAAPSLGCLKGAAAAATKGVLEATAEEHQENQHAVRRETKELVAEVAGDQGVQKAMHDLVLASVLGAAEGVNQESVGRLTDTVVNATFEAMQRHGDAFAQHMVARLQPQIMEALRAAVAQSVDTASSSLRETAQRDLPALTETVMASTLEAAKKTISMQLEGQPGILGGTGEDSLVRAMTRQAVRGVDDALQAAAKEPAPGMDAVLQNVGHSLGAGLGSGLLHSNGLLIALACVFGAVTVGLVAALAMLWRLYRRSMRSLELLAASTHGNVKPLP